MKRKVTFAIILSIGLSACGTAFLPKPDPMPQITTTANAYGSAKTVIGSAAKVFTGWVLTVCPPPVGVDPNDKESTWRCPATTSDAELEAISRGQAARLEAIQIMNTGDQLLAAIQTDGQPMTAEQVQQIMALMNRLHQLAAVLHEGQLS